MKKRRIRISDVAELAGVSSATVSVVVNDRIGDQVRVSPETVQRVWEAVRELGYVASPVARRLAGGHNLIIGIFTYEPIFPIRSRNFYYPFLIGIEEEAEYQGYDLLLFTSTRQQEGKRSIFQDGVNRLQIADGAIFVGLGEDKNEIMTLADAGFPFVFVGRRDLPRGEISYVAADYATATEEIVQQLIAHGHNNIAYIGSHQMREAHIDRQIGYERGLIRIGLPQSNDQVYRLNESELNRNRLWDWLNEGITAFVVENNALGHRLIETAKKIGKRTPQDFSMAVLGDSLVPGPTEPNWTMFKIPRKEMGSYAVKLLVQVLKNDDPQVSKPPQVTLPCTFEPGNTVARPLIK